MNNDTFFNKNPWFDYLDHLVADLMIKAKESNKSVVKRAAQVELARAQLNHLGGAGHSKSPGWNCSVKLHSKRQFATPKAL